jgi:hypothetical protein
MQTHRLCQRVQALPAPKVRKETQMMQNVMQATDGCAIGFTYWNFIVPHDGKRGGPKYNTQRYNPREAMTESLKDLRMQIRSMTGQLVKDRVEWAITMGVRREWIKNLEEIEKWRPGGEEPIPRVEWTEEAYNKIAHLFNGNHRQKLLEEEVEDLIKQLGEVKDRMKKYNDVVKPSRAQRNQHETDEKIKADLEKTLGEVGNFIVKLVDLGE